MSASGGTGAPVKMRTASPGPIGPSKRAPAAETPTTRRLAPVDGVGRVHGVAVHRRGGEGRLRARRHHVAGEDAAGGARERHLLGLERIEEAHQAGVGLRDGEERHQGASKRPDLPPSFSASRMSPMTMPRSTAFSMS